MFKRFVSWFMTTKAWRWVAGNIIAHFTFRVWGYPEFPMADYFKIIDVIGVSQVARNRRAVYGFSCSDHQSLASKLIRWVTGGRGKYSHSGWILPDQDRNTKAMHMQGNGLVIEPLLDVLKRVDYFTLVEIALPQDGYERAQKRIAYIMNNQLGIKYDYAQTLNNGPKIYCSELVYIVCREAIDSINILSKPIWGRRVFDPDAVIKLGDIIYTNHPDEVKP